MSNTTTLWLTGLSGAGKTTLGKMLCSVAGAILIDGNELRSSLCSDLGFSHNDRRENLRRAASIARMLNDQGVDVVVALISPLADDRKLARTIIGKPFFLVYISTPLSVCAKRDPLGLYKKAHAGLVNDMTGISAPYEKPLTEEAKVIIDMAANTVSAGVDIVRNRLFEITGKQWAG